MRLPRKLFAEEDEEDENEEDEELFAIGNTRRLRTRADANVLTSYLQ